MASPMDEDAGASDEFERLTQEAHQLEQNHSDVTQVLTQSLTTADLRALWDMLQEPQYQNELQAVQAIHMFLVHRNVALSPVSAAIVAQLCRRRFDELVQLHAVLFAFSLGHQNPMSTPMEEPEPLQLTAEQLQQLRERHRQEFLSQGRALMQICQQQQQNQSGPSLHIITQMEAPMVVRGYKTREPHFEPPFSLQIRPLNAHIVGPVEAYFLNENMELVVSQAFDQRDCDTNNMVMFGGLRIPANTSTRMSRSFILFSAYVLCQNQLMWIGALSHPLICITNSSQLCSAKARLIWYSFNLPDEQGMIEWDQLQPTLINYFQRVTTPSGKAARNFGVEDMNFLFQRINMQTSITWPVFRDFWHWFCTTAETCRERLGERWVTAVGPNNQYWLIHGFLGRNDANQVLAGQPIGTFIIRFSESKPNNLVASFIASTGGVEHKLIEPRNFEGGRNLDDVVNRDFRFITALYTVPGQPLPKAQAFPNPTNIPNRYDHGGYI